MDRATGKQGEKKKKKKKQAILLYFPAITTMGHTSVKLQSP
jgi:hypothetical protein